jgi:hypothetical protein
MVGKKGEKVRDDVFHDFVLVVQGWCLYGRWIPPSRQESVVCISHVRLLSLKHTVISGNDFGKDLV